MFVVRIYDSSSKWLGNFAGVSGGEAEVNRKLLCSYKFHNLADADSVVDELLRFYGEEYSFKSCKIG